MSQAQVRHALTFCAVCPVRIDCLYVALRTGERHGIWGGLTPRQRNTLMKNADGDVRKAITILTYERPVVGG